MTYQLDSEEMADVKRLLRLLGDSIAYGSGDERLAIPAENISEVVRLTEDLNRRLQ
jgi:hypothetical protein